MHLEKFVSQYSLEDVLQIESQDSQFLSLQNARKKISSVGKGSEDVGSVFCLLVIQNALISFQVAGSGPSWREEFSEKVVLDFDFLYNQLIQGFEIVDWWYNFLTNSRYNNRLYNNKRKRLERFSMVEKDILDFVVLQQYHDDMRSLNEFLALGMGQKKTDKTIVFSTKMFGYAARIVFGEQKIYPMDVSIPLDSRLKKIYKMNVSGLSTQGSMIEYYDAISKKFSIPPLHLDSLLWLEYRDRFVIQY